MSDQSIQEIRNLLDQRIGQRDYIDRTLIKAKKKKKRLLRAVSASERARESIYRVAKQTQEELQFHISEMVSHALQSVFNDVLEFRVEFLSRRGKMEADCFFIENDKKIGPMDGGGGGAVDITSLILRLSLWTLRKNRPILILDEPLKFLKGSDFPIKGAEMIKRFSEKIGVQIIMVSHDPELIDSSNRIIEIGKRNGISWTKKDKTNE